jgi:DNA-binding transcriptional MerR regulator
VLEGMNTSSHSELYEPLDWEWADLIAKARTMGMTIEEIRHFLSEASAQETSKGKRQHS